MAADYFNTPDSPPQGEPQTNPILIRKSRLWGVEIALHDRNRLPEPYRFYGERWLLECRDHGGSEEFQTKRAALRMMSHSDEWCVTCIENGNRLYSTNRWNKAATEGLPKATRYAAQRTADAGQEGGE